MAVTVISAPEVAPVVISASYPVQFTLESDQFGNAGITQFRYVLEIASTYGDLGLKYTVPRGGVTPSRGVIDIANTLRGVIRVSPEAYSGPEWLPQITEPTQQANTFTVLGFTINIYEQYYNNGVFTQNAGPSYSLVAGRGWTDDPDFKWLYINWYQVNANEFFIPFSGYNRIVYPQRLEDASWPDPATEPFMQIELSTYLGGVEESWWVERTGFGYSKVLYIPLFKDGVTNVPGWPGWTISIRTSATSGVGGTLQESYSLKVSREQFCDEEDQVIMFRDRLFQWSFMPFPMKWHATVNAVSQQAKGTGGRFRYNVDSSNSVTLNSNWMEEEANPLMQDLVVSEEAYLMAADGSLTPVTIQTNSLRIKTRRNDGLIQYSINIRKAEDNFKP